MADLDISASFWGTGSVQASGFTNQWNAAASLTGVGLLGAYPTARSLLAANLTGSGLLYAAPNPQPPFAFLHGEGFLAPVDTKHLVANSIHLAGEGQIKITDAAVTTEEPRSVSLVPYDQGLMYGLWPTTEVVYHDGYNPPQRRSLPGLPSRLGFSSGYPDPSGGAWFCQYYGMLILLHVPGDIVVVGITFIDTGVGLTGGPITHTGTISLQIPVTIDHGGTSATTAAAALANLGGAPLNSPFFTGNPQAPTPPIADSDNSIATTAWVKSQGYIAGGPYMPITGGVFTGDITVPHIHFSSVPHGAIPAFAWDWDGTNIIAYVNDVSVGIMGHGTITSVTGVDGLYGGGTIGAVTIGLTTPVQIGKGGTAATTAAQALLNLGGYPSTGGTVSGSVNATGNVTAGGAMSAVGNITGGSMNTGNLTASGTISGANINASVNINATGRVDGQYIYSRGNLDIAGTMGISGGLNVTGTANANYGNVWYTFYANRVNTNYLSVSGNGALTGRLDTSSLYAAYINSTGAVDCDHVYAHTYLHADGALDVYGHADLHAALLVTGNIELNWMNSIVPLYDGVSYCGVCGQAWNAVFSYNFVNVSDPAKKWDIASIPTVCLDLVNAIEPKTFRWKIAPEVMDDHGEPMPPDTGIRGTHWGFLYPDVSDVMTDPDRQLPNFAGAYEDRGGGMLCYNELTAVLWQAVRELSEKVERLEKQITQH